jgi:hypothetical protein
MVIGRVVQRIPVDGAWIRVFARSQDGDAVFAIFATLLLHMQFLVCCIHRLNPRFARQHSMRLSNLLHS